VKLAKTEGDWAFVEAIEQREHTHNQRWQGYPGWIPHDRLVFLHHPARANAVVSAKWAMVWRDPHGLEPWFQLPMGAKVIVVERDSELWQIQLLSSPSGWISRGHVHPLRDLTRLPNSRRRQMILRAAQELLGDPYFWGGRSPHAPQMGGVVTGVDCSGLANLAYRTAGIEVPRDAHEQYLRARKIPVPQPADLIFLSARQNPKQIVHVILYAGDGWVIEGPGTGLAVRRIEVAERLGRPINQLKPGDQIDRQTLSFGAYLP
jgi:hypothetical protein